VNVTVLWDKKTRGLKGKYRRCREKRCLQLQSTRSLFCLVSDLPIKAGRATTQAVSCRYHTAVTLAVSCRYLAAVALEVSCR
jgi:hypothetical protein